MPQLRRSPRIFSNSASPGQVPSDALNAYIGAVGGAVDLVGSSAWRQAYETSEIAAYTVLSDVKSGAGATKTLGDAIGLYNTLVAGVVGSVAENASSQSYSALLQNLGAIQSDIVNNEPGSWLASDVSTLHNKLAGSAAGNAAWQAALSASEQAAAAVSGASGTQILSAVSALYDFNHLGIVEREWRGEPAASL